jgi:hypothetical protein
LWSCFARGWPSALPLASRLVAAHGPLPNTKAVPGFGWSLTISKGASISIRKGDHHAVVMRRCGSAFNTCISWRGFYCGDSISPTEPSYFFRAFLGARAFLPGAAMLKSSSFLPEFSAAASHRGFSPRPAHVSAGFAGLRYFGATGPRVPPRIPFKRNPLVVRRDSFVSWSCTARRSSIIFELRTASTWSLSFDNLPIDIDLRFMGVHSWSVG